MRSARPEAARRDIEQSTKDGARDAERKVGEHAVRIVGSGTFRASARNTATLPADANRCASIDTSFGSSSNASTWPAIREHIGERAPTCAELDHAIVARDAGVGDELRCESRATEEVLAEPIPSGAPGRYVPGHGRPRPWDPSRGEHAFDQTVECHALDFRRSSGGRAAREGLHRSALKSSAAAAILFEELHRAGPGDGSIAGERASSQASTT